MLSIFAALLLQAQPEPVRVYIRNPRACSAWIDNEATDLNGIAIHSKDWVKQGRSVELRGQAEGDPRCFGIAYLMIKDQNIPVTLVTFPEILVLSVPAGGCDPQADGDPAPIARLPELARIWKREERRIELRVDPAASAGCTASVLAGLEKFPKSRLSLPNGAGGGR